MASLQEQIEIAEGLEARLADEARQAWNTYVDRRDEQVKAAASLRVLRARQTALLEAADLVPAEQPTAAMPVTGLNANHCRNC